MKPFKRLPCFYAGGIPLYFGFKPIIRIGIRFTFPDVATLNELTIGQTVIIGDASYQIAGLDDDSAVAIKTTSGELWIKPLHSSTTP